MYEKVRVFFTERDLVSYDHPEWIEKFASFAEEFKKVNNFEIAYYHRCALPLRWFPFVKYLIEHNQKISDKTIETLLSIPKLDGPSLYYTQNLIKLNFKTFYALIVHMAEKYPALFQSIPKHNLYYELLQNKELNQLILSLKLSGPQVETLYRHLSPLLRKRIPEGRTTIRKVLMGFPEETENLLEAVKQIPSRSIGKLITGLLLTNDINEALALASQKISRRQLQESSKVLETMEDPQNRRELISGKYRKELDSPANAELAIPFIRHPLAYKYPLAAAMIMTSAPYRNLREHMGNLMNFATSLSGWDKIKTPKTFSYNDLKEATLHLNLRKIVQIRRVLNHHMVFQHPICHRTEFLEYVESLPDSNEPLQKDEILRIWKPTC